MVERKRKVDRVAAVRETGVKRSGENFRGPHVLLLDKTFLGSEVKSRSSKLLMLLAKTLFEKMNIQKIIKIFFIN